MTEIYLTENLGSEVAPRSLSGKQRGGSGDRAVVPVLLLGEVMGKKIVKIRWRKDLGEGRRVDCRGISFCDSREEQHVQPGKEISGNLSKNRACCHHLTAGGQIDDVRWNWHFTSPIKLQPNWWQACATAARKPWPNHTYRHQHTTTLMSCVCHVTLISSQQNYLPV